jgi:glyoxylase-like metal-dependent hydrolase (beta-lactamase superfamily II)
LLKGSGIGLLALAALAALVVSQRHVLLVHALALTGPQPLAAAGDEGPDVRWFDDYFTIQVLDARTFAIGEPRYSQANYSYLIAGSERAVLFDAGPGLRDIRPVAQSLTDLPITFVPSHFHYDHIGNEVTFEDVAVVDLPYLRARAPNDRLRLTFAEHLGVAEGIDAPTLEVDAWLPPGSTLALGERSLRVLYTPGHTEDSISLLDIASAQLFSGDFIYPGPLFAFLPNSGMADYQQGVATVLRTVPEAARIFGAHRLEPPGVPELEVRDVHALQTTLEAIHDGELAGEGLYPVSYRINDRLELLAEPRWLQRWTPRHPELACASDGAC